MNGGQTVEIETWWAFILFGSFIINALLMICFLYTKLEGAEELLHDVKFVCWYKNFFGKSLIGRQARLNAISMVVMMPGLMQKRGELSQEAYSRLPTSLATQIRALYMFSFANCLGLASFCFIVD
jgi:hypothetical protein